MNCLYVYRQLATLLSFCCHISQVVQPCLEAMHWVFQRQHSYISGVCFGPRAKKGEINVEEKCKGGDKL